MRYVIEGKVMMTGITYLSKDGKMIISSFSKSKIFKVTSISLVCNVIIAIGKSETPDVQCVQIEGRGITVSSLLD